MLRSFVAKAWPENLFSVLYSALGYISTLSFTADSVIDAQLAKKYLVIDVIDLKNCRPTRFELHHELMRPFLFHLE